MYLRTRRPAVALSALAVLAAVSLSACGDDTSEGDAAGGGDSTATETDTPEVPETTDAETETEAPVETVEPEVETETADPGAAGGTGTNPSWANPVATAGDLLTTIDVGDVSVEVYQVGTSKADDTGFFVDPDTNKPLIEVGDTLVFLNYVATNNGAPIDLGSSLIDVEARYDDWPYLGGMDGLTGDDLYEAQGVHDGDLAPGGFNETGVYTFGTGESISFAENFEYQKNSPITFDVSYVPVDAQGELLHDNKVETEGAATVK